MDEIFIYFIFLVSLVGKFFYSKITISPPNFGVSDSKIFFLYSLA